MPVYKMTFIFSAQGQSWSESYYLNLVTASDPQTIYTLYAQPLGTARLACTGLDATLDWVRVGQVGVPFYAQSFRDGRAGTYATSCLPPNLALLIRCAPLLPGPNKSWFFRGAPDTILKNTTYTPPNAFTKALQALFQALAPPQITTFGWYGRQSSVKAPVTGYTVTTGFQVQVTTQNPIFTVTTPPKHVNIRFTGINGKSELNGNQVCTVLSTSEVQTVDQFGVIPYSRGGTATVVTNGFTGFFQFRDDRLMTRKAGRIGFLERGRAAVRPKT